MTRLRMSAELGDWLAELCTFHPASAAEVAAALTSVMTADDPSALPLVRQPGDSLDLRQAVDYDYQEQLEALRRVRRHVAEIAMDRKHWATEVEEAESAGRPDEVLAQLRLRQAEAAKREHDLTERSQRLQRDVDAFRTAKEVAKAMYTAAEATARIRDATEAAVGSGSVPERDDALAAQRRAVNAAEANLHAVAEREGGTNAARDPRPCRTRRRERRRPRPGWCCHRCAGAAR